MKDNFLNVRMGAWERKHGDGSMGMGEWGRENRDGIVETGVWGKFFLFVFCQKKFDQII